MAKQTKPDPVNGALSKKDSEAAVKKLLTTFGKKYQGLVKDKAPEIEYICSTGSINLDICLGGGIPKGKILQIVGKEQTGKTLLCLMMAASVQKNGGNVLYVDAENRFDAVWARIQGVITDDPMRFLVLQPSTGEEGLNAVVELIKTGHYDLVIFDSIATARPSAELDKDVEEHVVGRHAVIISKFIYKASIACASTGTSLVCINQIRMAIGVMFGNPETTTGGNAIKFSLLYNIGMMSPKIEVDSDDIQESMLIRYKMKKSARSYLSKGEVKVDLKRGGIDKQAEVIDMGSRYGILDKKGAWYWLGDQRLDNGADKSAEYLRQNPEMEEEIRNKIMESVTSITSTS